jgi:CheY-like chemotaxis protein
VRILAVVTNNEVKNAKDSSKAIHDADEGRAARITAKHILVAEDSPIIQDLLKLVLEQRGYYVDIAVDGESALTALGAHPYDVALIDFHLPKLNGLLVVAKFLEANPHGFNPRFIAITADVPGLLSRDANCANFDEVIAKPFDIDQILYAIENGKISTGKPHAPVLIIPRQSEQPTNIANTIWRQFDLLHWPDDLSAGSRPGEELRANVESGKYEGILIKAPATIRDFSAIWTTRALHLLPVIDMTGTVKHADFDASELKLGQSDKLSDLIQQFRDNRTRLHRDLIHTDDISEKLLGRMFVMGGMLTPRYDPDYREYISYNTLLDFQSIDKEIRDLDARGFVEKEFFDRFHCCHRCGSSRAHVHERCLDCGSANLDEEAYLHHFRCAYQGPESDFVRGRDLVCPKCRRELSHFSVDYDKPGTTMKCRSCGKSTSEPAVAFVCMDCGAPSPAELMTMRDVYSYKLTEQGIRFIEAGRALLDGKHAALRFAGLPLALLISLDAASKAYQASGKPFTLLSFACRNARAIELSDGLRILNRSRDLFLENIRNTFGQDDSVVKGHSYDYLLIRNVSPEEIRSDISDIIKDASEPVKLDLGIEFEIFGPEDFK